MIAAIPRFGCRRTTIGMTFGDREAFMARTTGFAPDPRLANGTG
jgi:hypothetical protein